MTQFNFNKETTAIFTKIMRKITSGNPILAGDLLFLGEDSNSTGIERIHPFKSGYPRYALPDELIHLSRIAKGEPFMFLGWAAYDKLWFPPLKAMTVSKMLDSEEWELQTHLAIITNEPGCSFGMNIFFKRTAYFLTTDYSSTIAELEEQPLRVNFVYNVLPRIKK